MDREEVGGWLAATYHVPRETLEQLERFVSLLEEENGRQNLVARSTLPHVWDRHIRDSAQLLGLVPERDRAGRWFDLGSGPGLPGLVLAIVGEMDMVLVEARRKRFEFLEEVVAELGLEARVRVEGRRLERVTPAPADVITARAFAPLPKLIDLACPFTTECTRWLLPKGKNVEAELAEARRVWQGRFETVQSLTDPESFIVTASEVRRR